ncbi:MAG: hypothetical protein ACI9E3_000212, partial [Flavobacteriales bacterium]
KLVYVKEITSAYIFVNSNAVSLARVHGRIK